MKYLALGDSYTIGETVPKNGSFPFQLAKALEKNALTAFDEVKVIAKTGWTTDELKEAISTANPNSDYDLVSLLIGVNNQYRGYPINQFDKEFEELLKLAIGFAKGKNSNVVVVAIPDYGCTPFGAEKANQIDVELKQYNQICAQKAKKYGVAFVNTYKTSKRAKSESELIADDQLHPSQKMYTLWVNEILPIAEKIIQLP